MSLYTTIAIMVFELFALAYLVPCCIKAVMLLLKGEIKDWLMVVVIVILWIFTSVVVSGAIINLRSAINLW